MPSICSVNCFKFPDQIWLEIHWNTTQKTSRLIFQYALVLKMKVLI